MRARIFLLITSSPDSMASTAALVSNVIISPIVTSLLSRIKRTNSGVVSIDDFRSGKIEVRLISKEAN